MLKTRTLVADKDGSAYISPIAHGYRAEPELTLDFYVDGRQHRIRLTDAQVAQIARTAIRGYGRTTPDHPTVFDIEDTRGLDADARANELLRDVKLPD